MNEFVAAIGDAVVAGDTMGSGEFIVVIVKVRSPILRGMTLEEWHKAGALHVGG